MTQAAFPHDAAMPHLTVKRYAFAGLRIGGLIKRADT
jgi:hypothetical protein